MAKDRSAVAFQVMWNRLISVVEEQAQALVRAAFSTSVREAGDLSAGVYDAQGRMLAQAVTGTPGHVNAMADAVAHFIRRIGRQNMAEGDVYLTNDPWEGTGHLHDITMVTPSFHKGALVGFLAAPRMWWISAGGVSGRMPTASMRKASTSPSCGLPIVVRWTRRWCAFCAATCANPTS